MADNQAGEIGELLGMRPVAGRLQQSSIPARVSGSGALGSSPYYVWFARRLHVRVLNGRAWEIVVQQEVLVRLPHLLLVNPSRFLTPLTVWTYNVITKLCVHLWTWIILYDIHCLSSISAFARRWAKRCTSSGLVEYSYMSVCMYVCTRRIVAATGLPMLIMGMLQNSKPGSDDKGRCCRISPQQQHFLLFGGALCFAHVLLSFSFYCSSIVRFRKHTTADPALEDARWLAPSDSYLNLIAACLCVYV